MRKKKEVYSRIYVFLRRRETTVVEWKLPLCSTFGVVTSINTSIWFTLPCHTFHDIKIRQANLKLLKKKKKNTWKQSRIKESHSPSIRNSCFYPIASFSCLVKLTPLLRALDCNNSYCACYDWTTRNSNKHI